jgi:hypothetical protein
MLDFFTLDSFTLAFFTLGCFTHGFFTLGFFTLGYFTLDKITARLPPEKMGGTTQFRATHVQRDKRASFCFCTAAFPLYVWCVGVIQPT